MVRLLVREELNASLRTRAILHSNEKNIPADLLFLYIYVDWKKMMKIDLHSEILTHLRYSMSRGKLYSLHTLRQAVSQEMRRATQSHTSGDCMSPEITAGPQTAGELLTDMDGEVEEVFYSLCYLGDAVNLLVQWEV